MAGKLINSNYQDFGDDVVVRCQRKGCLVKKGMVRKRGILWDIYGDRIDTHTHIYIYDRETFRYHFVPVNSDNF